MNNFETIQKILKENNIEFKINDKEACNDDDLKEFDIILLEQGMNNVEGYAFFCTYLFFNKKNGRLQKFKHSGVTAIHANHQEIILELNQEKA